MKGFEFYQKYANLPIGERFELLSNDYTSPILGMTMAKVYEEIKAIDDRLRKDEARKEELLNAVETLWQNQTKKQSKK